MNLQLEKNAKTSKETHSSHQSNPEQIKQEMRRRIYEALQIAKDLPANDCLSEIRNRLSAVQLYCQSVGKTFIFVEQAITCDQYELGGSQKDSAVLFRGPSEDASVAVCVTEKGSLLHRNSSPWRIYRNVGDVSSTEQLSLV